MAGPIFHDGFETGGADAWPDITGSPTFTAAAAHSGNYGMEAASTGSVCKVGRPGSYYRVTTYIDIVTAPDATCIIICPDTYVNVRLTSSRYLQLYSGSTLKDTGSTQLNTGQSYRVCLTTDGAGNAKIHLDGAEECSGTAQTGPIGDLELGIISSGVTATIRFDDCLADYTTSTDDLGDIRVLGARPVSDGTDNDVGVDMWQDPADNNATYDHIDSDPPNTTDYLWEEANGTWHSFSVNMDECGSGNLSGIGGSDTIEAVNFMWYYATGGGGVGDYGCRIYDQSTATDDDAIDDPKDATWLQKYEPDAPSDASAWTQTIFNTVEMGMRCQDANKDLTWYEAYAMVAYQLAEAAMLNAVASDGVTVSEAVDAELDHLEAVCSDSVTVSEAVVAELDVLEASCADSVTVSESVGGELLEADLEATCSDDVTVSESVAAELDVLEAAVADSLTVTESIAAELDVLEATGGDSLTVTEALSAALDHYEAVSSDSLTIGESVAAELDVLEAVCSESVTVSESTAAELDVLEAAASDSVTVGEAVEASIGGYLEAVCSEAVTVSESVTAELDHCEASASDAVTVSEAVAAELDHLEATAAESVSISESVNASIAGILEALASDSVTVSESLAAQLDRLEAVGSDSVTISEQVQAELDVLEATATDNVTVTESVDALVPVLCAVAGDSVTVTESVSAQFPVLKAAVSDAITISETVAAQLPVLVASVADSVIVSESVAAEIPMLEASATDAVTISEAVAALLTGGAAAAYFLMLKRHR